MADDPAVCRHLHIPLQSGDAGILEAMGRRYTPARYRAVVERAVDLMPGIGIGVDVMTGFPGETDAAWRNTCALLQDLPVSYLHVFQFSPRSGTPAAALPDRLPPQVIRERSRRLRALGEQKKREFLIANVGRLHRVLFEEAIEDTAAGLTSNYLRMQAVGADTDEPMADVLATGVDGDVLQGVVPAPAETGTKAQHSACASI
jgi:threonylcarbamoyladenosine tRNA methylthiotransferase MtaB